MYKHSSSRQRQARSMDNIVEKTDRWRFNDLNINNNPHLVFINESVNSNVNSEIGKSSSNEIIER